MRSETTRPPSPTTSESSEFEFNVSISPRKASSSLCPADELFYKGQLLPLQHSPRLSLVRTLLLSSDSSSSARDSTGSSSSTDSTASSFPLLTTSSVTEDDDLLLKPPKKNNPKASTFSLSRFSSVFKKDPKNPSATVKRISSSAREVIRKYLKKAKPLYDKFSQKQQLHNKAAAKKDSGGGGGGGSSVSLSGDLRYPRRRRCVSSCPSSMRSSPSHSGVLSRAGFLERDQQSGRSVCCGSGDISVSSMEELQSAIQGAIAHCKNSMLQNTSLVSLEI